MTIIQPSGSSGGSVDSFSTPSRLGYLAMNHDPQMDGAQSVLITLQPRIEKLLVPTTITIANVIYDVTVAGSALTAGSNQCGVYLSSGTRIASTTPATTAANFLVTGIHQDPLTVDGGQSLTIAGGPTVFVWVAYLSSGTTPVTMPRETGAGADFLNGLLSVATSRCGSLPVVISGNGLPTSFTPGVNITQTSVSFWAGLA
jgi:hypothetical protein